LHANAKNSTSVLLKKPLGNWVQKCRIRQLPSPRLSAQDPAPQS